MMSNEVNVSVCLLSLNRLELLREALTSVYAQTRKPKEIIILDAGSESRVKEGIHDFLNQGVQWCDGDRTKNQQWNFRRAFSRVLQPYLFVMHDDDRVLPEFLEKQVQFLDSHPSVVAVACGGYQIDGHGNRTVPMIVPANYLNEQGEIWLNTPAEVAAFYAEWYLYFPSLVFRNPYPSQTPLGDEYANAWDVVFMCDLATSGPICCQNVPLFEWRQHAQQMSSRYSPAKLTLMENYLLKKTVSNPVLFIKTAGTVFKKRMKRAIKPYFKSPT